MTRVTIENSRGNSGFRHARPRYSNKMIGNFSLSGRMLGSASPWVGFTSRKICPVGEPRQTPESPDKHSTSLASLVEKTPPPGSASKIPRGSCHWLSLEPNPVARANDALIGRFGTHTLPPNTNMVLLSSEATWTEIRGGGGKPLKETSHQGGG